MAGDKGSVAPKLRCEPEIVHVGRSVGFGVFVGQSESEQIPTSELKLKGKWRVLYPSSGRTTTTSANGESGERHFTFLLKAAGTISHGQAEWREGVNVSGPLGHEVPALLQGVGCQV